ncbi:MAG: transcription termination factor NusA [Candidatus Firestonebacteria bacterium]
MNRPFLEALEQIGRSKNIEKTVLISALQEALISASKKTFGTGLNISIDFTEKTGDFKIYLNKKVVETVSDPNIEISLENAKIQKSTIAIDDTLQVEIPQEMLNKIAVRTAKSVIVQKVREAERNHIFEEFNNQIGNIVASTVIQKEGEDFIIDVGGVDAILLRKDQVYKENVYSGMRLKFYILSVKKFSKGPQIFLSREHPNFIKKLFELEVPEITDKIVSIKNLVRDPGYRTKMLVYSENKNVDPVGACVGIRGSRVQAIVKELMGEKIDIIQWDADIKTLIINAFNPAKIISVEINEQQKSARVIVPDDQIILVIGKKGQNIRLTERLIGLNIRISSETEAKKENILPKDELKINSIEQIDGISKKLAEKIMSSGFKTLEDLSKLDIQALCKIPGIGEKTAEKIISNIKKSIAK